jgi:chromosome segregation ATPase
LNSETKAILDALLESRKIVEAKLETMDTKLGTMDTKLGTMDTKLGTMATDIAEIKERLTDMETIDRHLLHKTAELEADLTLVKRRQKA